MLGEECLGDRREVAALVHALELAWKGVVAAGLAMLPWIDPSLPPLADSTILLGVDREDASYLFHVLSGKAVEFLSQSADRLGPGGIIYLDISRARPAAAIVSVTSLSLTSPSCVGHESGHSWRLLLACFSPRAA